MRSGPTSLDQRYAAAGVVWGARQLAGLFKLRIGLAIALAAVAGYTVTPAVRSGWTVLVLALAVLVASGAGGALNQYLERYRDACMPRTRGRLFASGRLRAGYRWPLGFFGLLIVGVLSAAAWLNPLAAAFVAAGALVYVVVYTMWLKPRTWVSIVIGGLAGSLAVLAGSAAANPSLSPEAWALAVALFLWTPSHFWALAIAIREEYALAGIPMLPVVAGDRVTAWAILINSIALVAATLAPAGGTLGAGYLVAAMIGGAYLLHTNVRLVRVQDRRRAFSAFYASLAQLTLVLGGAVLDIHFGG